MNNFKVIILGSGPAGLTAAIYAARADLSPLVLAGPEPGGQLAWTTEVENFPGFEKGILGPDLMQQMEAQAKRFGAEIKSESAVKIESAKDVFVVQTDAGKYQSEAVIIATGASARWLGVPGEAELKGKGVSACATCDGFFFRGRDVVVVGGGDAAMEEALYLTKFATAVTVVHRRDAFRASKIMQDKVLASPKIKVVWNSVVIQINGADKVESVTLEDVVTKKQREMPTNGVFVAIGHAPNTEFLKGVVELDQKGYIVLHGETKTSAEGIFVAGDVFDHRYRQAVTAAGSGCKAAMDVEKYLESIIHNP